MPVTSSILVNNRKRKRENIKLCLSAKRKKRTINTGLLHFNRSRIETNNTNNGDTQQNSVTVRYDGESNNFMPGFINDEYFNTKVFF